MQFLYTQINIQYCAMVTDKMQMCGNAGMWVLQWVNVRQKCGAKSVGQWVKCGPKTAEGTYFTIFHFSLFL